MIESGTVILIDDDPDVLRSCAQSLELAGLEVEAHERTDAVLDRLGPDTDRSVVTDIRMPGTDGLALMPEALAANRYRRVLITGHGDVRSRSRRCGSARTTSWRTVRSRHLVRTVRHTL